MSDLQASFRALSDPTRRDILQMLGGGEMTIAEITEGFDITRAAVKKHLVILEQGNLITMRKQGRERINTLKPEALRPVMDWIGWFDQFWDRRLEDLKTAIEEENSDDQPQDS